MQATDSPQVEIISPVSQNDTELEKSPATRPRVKPGSFLPGHDPRRNAGGRPKNTVTSMLYRALEDGTTPEKLAKKLINHALKAKPGTSLQAIRDIQDRTEGKPVAMAIVGHTIDSSTAGLLADLAAKLLIDVTDE